MLEDPPTEAAAAVAAAMRVIAWLTMMFDGVMEPTRTRGDDVSDVGGDGSTRGELFKLKEDTDLGEVPICGRRGGLSAERSVDIFF